MTDKILISVLASKGEHCIGCIKLNKPKALNALDLDMVKAMQEQLDEWRVDDSIGAVFIHSEGDKAFCAGGDIVSMYTAMVKQQENNSLKLPDFMAQFFEREYRLDYSIHAFPKPIICWGNGIIMGGGLGVFAGASHKIVTQSARVAMPEITIGLFPDVGASYFLNKMPAGVGKFLGLSAASINAVDCINIGLADTFLLHQQKQALLLGLGQLPEVDSTSISKLIDELSNNEQTSADRQKMQGNLTPIIPALASLADLSNIDEIEDFLHDLQTLFPNEKIVEQALHNFKHGSLITAALVIQQLMRGKELTLAQCLQMELGMAYRCSIDGEFQEGVRALLIDKDMQPKWKYSKAGDIPSSFIEAYFNYFTYPNELHSKNPLQSLESEYGENCA